MSQEKGTFYSIWLMTNYRETFEYFSEKSFSFFSKGDFSHKFKLSYIYNILKKYLKQFMEMHLTSTLQCSEISLLEYQRKGNRAKNILKHCQRHNGPRILSPKLELTQKAETNVNYNLAL